MPPAPATRRTRPLPYVLLATGLVLSAFVVPNAAAAADGDLDLSFGIFGGAVYGNGYARAVVARADGSLRVAFGTGPYFGVLALDAGGAIDESFGVDGIRKVALEQGDFTNIPTALLERPDGRLLIVGNIDDLTKVALVQLTEDGDLDPDFSGDGIRLAWIGEHRSAAYAAVLQADGKVVFAGECYDCGLTGGGDTWISRFTATGGLDTGFGTNGSVLFDAVEGGDDFDRASAVAIDDLGRIVVGGSTGTYEDERPYIARRLAGGANDGSFAGGDGVRNLPTLLEQGVVGIAVEPGTLRPVAATGSRSLTEAPVACAVVRLRSTGALDPTFSGDGIASLTQEEGSNLQALRLQSDGRIVVAGSIDGDLAPVEGFFLARLLDDGTLDASFAGDGTRRVEWDLDANGRDVALAATLSGGRLVAAGFAIDEGAPRIAVLRTVSALLFADGFERGSAAGWPGN